ncbi:MAG TPA: ABC transporter permease [Candidatus Xenobia bacterium]|jgi:putative ABC transport system permease protein
MPLSRLLMLLRSAWRSLYRNKVRSLLTMLGIIIGVAAVIAMVALGRGSQARMEDEMARIGNNLLQIRSVPIMVNGISQDNHATLTADDAVSLKDACPSVQYVNPSVWDWDAPVAYEDQAMTARVAGISPDYFPLHHDAVAWGENLTDADVRHATRVCVLGDTVAGQLFGNRDPIGRTLRIRAIGFRVVGIKRVQGNQHGWYGDTDKMIFVPYTSVMEHLHHSRYIYSMSVAAPTMEAMPDAKNEVTAYLRQRHHIHGNLKDDFRVDDIEAMMDKWRQQQQIFSALLGGVAAISLLVGGIGIMNIMLVTVTERIKEIGTRMAIGARPLDIMLQFFLEALSLSMTGGLLGIALGVGTSHLVDQKWSAAIVSGPSIVLAFAVSCFIGIFFGFYPAFQASRLDPIEALRPE